jgi:hypothetical protein
MGWSVGADLDHDRHRGYGVPAWCDAYAKGCREVIDRGLGYACDAYEHYYVTDEEGEEIEVEFDNLDHPIFVCGDHTCKDVDEDNLPPEHPEWLEHVLTDESWEQWRTENPEKVDKYQASLETQRNLGNVLEFPKEHDDGQH